MYVTHIVSLYQTSNVTLCSYRRPVNSSEGTRCDRFLEPDALSNEGELGFKFDRSGYGVPAVIVSPWVTPNSVFTEEYRHTSLIATLRVAWELGPPFSARDATARTFQDVLCLEEPRDPVTWPSPVAVPVPQFQMERVAAGEAIGTLGRHLSEDLFCT